MKKPAAPTTDPALLAVMHRAGRSWRVLVVRLGGVRPAMIAAREFSLEQADRVNGYLNEQHVARALCVLPASAVICRTVPLPAASSEQLEPALRLQAEAHLIGTAPVHRLAMAVLPASLGENTRSGMILAWPESSEFIAPVTSVPVRYVPDVAAVAALLNGQRPTEPILWLDRGDGSVAIAVTHANGVIFRATREEAGDLDSWQRSVGRIVAETGLSVGHTGGFIESMVADTRAKAASIATRDAALFLPQEAVDSAVKRLDGAGDDRKWWHTYGIAAGAALAASSHLAPLVQMQHTPPIEQPSRIRSALEAMSRPRAAATVITLAIALLLLGPVMFAGLRLAVLMVRYGDVDAELRAARSAKAQLAVYRELDRQKTWPMTKLLSDIATNAPLGIEFESVRLEGGKDFSISGTAIANGGKNPPEIVANMRSNLNSDGVFTDLTVQWGDANNLGVYKFDITGKVARPFHTPIYPPERDFLTWTHEMRRDGKPAPTSGKQPKPVADSTGPALASSGTGSTPAPDTTDGNAGDGQPGKVDLAQAGTGDEGESAGVPVAEEPGAGDAAPGASGYRPNMGGTRVSDDPTVGGDGAALPAGQIPPPITEDEINAMDEAQLRKHLNDIAKARQYVPKTDKELDDRLKKEFNQILARLREVQKGGGA